MRYLIKLDDYYFEWSTGVDSPITDAMSKEDLKEYYFREYGNTAKTRREWKQKIAKVEEKGVDLEFDSVDELIKNNKAGSRNKCLTKEQIIERYQWDAEYED